MQCMIGVIRVQVVVFIQAFGLGDLLGNANKNKLMYMGQFYCTATKPTNDECNGVNSKYGGFNP